ncbi:hypothetical protein MK338_11235, partial [Streptococcus vestibularis]
GFDC